MKAFFIAILFALTLNASAQDPADGGTGGSAIDPGGSTGSPQAGSADGSVATSSATQAIPAADNQARATSSAPVPPPPPKQTPSPTPAPQPAPVQYAQTPFPIDNAQDPPSDAAGTVLAIVASILGAGALFAGAYSVLRTKKAKNNDSENKCFDIKKLMEEKLKELTDLRGELQSKVEGKAREAVRAATAGTAAGNALAAIEKAEKEYARLKQLYEKCITDLDKPKTLKFRPDLVPKVLDGSKTVTWRLFDDKDLKVGDELIFLNSEASKEFTRATITNVHEKKLGDMGEQDMQEGHERYESKDAMIQQFRMYYGERVNTDTLVKIITFKIQK